MALILNIDTATEVCSVALAENGEIRESREDREGMNHSVLLGVFVDEVLKHFGCRVADLDAVAVSMGPGSYTGLRIGVSLAKGLCYAAERPLIAVSTLASMTDHVVRTAGGEGVYCPMIDARRMEVYTALYSPSGEIIRDVHAAVITPESFREELEQQRLYFFGNGSDKVREVITHPNAVFIPGIYTSACHLAGLAERAWERQEFVDVAYFEPFYLKDFVATTPKKRL